MKLDYNLTLSQKLHLENFRRELINVITGENPTGLKIHQDDLIKMIVDLKTSEMMYRSLLSQAIIQSKELI